MPITIQKRIWKIQKSVTILWVGFMSGVYRGKPVYIWEFLDERNMWEGGWKLSRDFYKGIMKL